MKTCGIIAEYNPFHNGHCYQIQQARKLTNCDCLIVVMSGNFVQRGEPAVVDKWKRAKAAVQNGADLVIELPFLYVMQSASSFAHGAVSLLKRANVDAISFGSECGNLENLLEIADTPVNPDHLHMSLSTGMSFPKAYSLLTSTMEPNDILAVSYLKEIKGTDIEPILVQRTSAYNSLEINQHASALAIRKAMHDHQPYDSSTPMAKALAFSNPVFIEQYWPYIRTLLLTSSRQRLQEMFLVNEGIETHLVNHAKQAFTWNEFLSACTSWRYTASRIRRTLWHIAMQNTKTDVKRLPEIDTLRILAFNDTGRKWLHEMRGSDQKIASKFSDMPYPWRQMEYRAALLYTSVMSQADQKRILDLEIKGAHYIK